MNLLAASLAAVLLVGAPAGTANCEVTDAALTWGFKESFRSYISSSIANGEWTVSDGATYSTPDFGWSAGTGEVPGTVSFTGSVEFTGHGGILDTTVSDPRLVFDGSRTARLLIDVSGTTQEGLPVSASAVEFATVDLSGGLVDAPVTLTPDGAAAFGTYEAGEQFDPITIELADAASCALPASPPLGALVGGAVLVAGIAVAAVALRRRKVR